MAQFTKMKESAVPRPPRETGRLAVRMRQYEDYVSSLKAGEAGKLLPDSGETSRGIALRVSRAAKRLGKSADTWVVEGAVYFRVG